MSTIADKEATVPDGLHHRRGVEYLAAAAGMEPDKIGAVVVFDNEALGFSETTGFIKSSNGRGYYRTTLTACTCPSFKFRGGLCKHQKRLDEELQKRAGPSLPAGVVPLSSEEMEARRRRIEERNVTWARAPLVEERPSRGFTLPEEVRA